MEHPINSINSVRCLIDFYKSFNKQNQDISLNFIQKEKKISEFRLKLSLTHEIINKKTNFIFIIKKVEKLLSLKEKSDSKNRLLSAFTHELKTPLNGSIPPLQEVRNHLSKSSAVYVDRAMASLKVLENSLNNIIDYSLATSDQLIIHLTKVDLDELLNEIFLIVKSQVEMKKLQLSIEIDREVLKSTVLTDYNRLKQLILNIVLNAVQFTNKGSIIVAVNEISKGVIEFSIEDTGLGITSDNLEVLKKKLQEVENENEENNVNTTGFCFGLMMSQRIALLLGKQGLEIHSSPNEGTTVKFSINDQNQPDDNKTICSKSSKKSEKIKERSKRIYSIRTKNMTNQRTLRHGYQS